MTPNLTVTLHHLTPLAAGFEPSFDYFWTILLIWRRAREEASGLSLAFEWCFMEFGNYDGPINEFGRLNHCIYSYTPTFTES